VRPDRAVSSAEEHILDMDGVAGSIPAPPTSKINSLVFLARKHRGVR
jgi:hypothetical protein